MTAASRTDHAKSGDGCPERASTSPSALENSLIWARQTLKCSLSMPVDTLSSAPCAALRSASASAPNTGGRHVRTVNLLIGLVYHHALGEHAGERFIHADMAGGLHGANEEAAVEQMQNRVLDAADILVHRHLPVDHGARGRRVLVPGIGEAREIPR